MPARDGLAPVLGQGERRPERLIVAAIVTLDEVEAPMVIARALEVRGEVPDVDSSGSTPRPAGGGARTRARLCTAILCKLIFAPVSAMEVSRWHR